MTLTCDWTCRENSRSTSRRSSRIGSKSWASVAAEGFGAAGFKSNLNISRRRASPRGLRQSGPSNRSGREDPYKVGGRRGRYRVTRRSLQAGNRFGHLDDVRRLVALAAIRYRSQKRAVGLDEQPVQWDQTRHFLQFRGARKRDDTGQRQVVPRLERPASHRPIPGKAVQDHRNLGRLLLFENAEGVVFGFPRVNHDRKPPFARQRNLAAKHGLLGFPGREIVVVVEADLAQATGQRLPVDRRRHGACRLSGVGGELPRRVWMHADGEPDAAPPLRDRPRLFNLRLVVRGEDNQRMCQAGGGRARYDGVEIGSEFRPGDVAMGIDQTVSEPAFPAASTDPPTATSAPRPRRLLREPSRSIRCPSASPVSGWPQ